MRFISAPNNRSVASSEPPDQLSLSFADHRKHRTKHAPDLGLEALEFEPETIYGGSPSPVQKPIHQRPVQISPEILSPSRQLDTQWSPVLQQVLDQPPSQLPSRILMAGFLFACAFGAWAWFGRIQEVSHAQGRLEPKGNVYKIQPVTQGEIAQILVKEGETIEKGQTIAVLDSRLAQSEVDRLKQSLMAYQVQLTQTQGIIEQTHLEMKTRQAIAKADSQAQESAIAQAKAKAATSSQMIAQLQAEREIYQVRLNRLKPLLAEGVLSEEHLFEVEQSVRERERMMVQSEGETEQYLKETEQLQAGLAQKQAEGERSELETQQRLQQLKQEMATTQAKITETENLLKAAQTKLEQMYLYAPIGGTISTLNVHNIGEVAQPSQTIAEIAPEHAPLILSAILPTREAGFVKEGMKVHLKFDSFPYQEHGIVEGKVASVSPDAKVDENMGAVYQVEIAINPGESEQHHIKFKAGQTANAEIVTRQKRVLDLLLDPIKKLQGGVSL